MKRREFITLLGGAAAWPLAARAQQDRQRLVGVVAGFSESEMRPQLTALRSKLSQLGWTEGRNLEIDTRLGAGDFQRMTVEAGSLVSRNPDVIVTMGTPGLNAVRHHTKSVPVVFQLRSRLVGDSGPGDGDNKGRPMIVTFHTCVDSIRTIPFLQHDPDRAEDIMTDSEDHAADEWRYACMSRPYVRTIEKPLQKIVSGYRPWRGAEQPGDWKTY